MAPKRPPDGGEPREWRQVKEAWVLYRKSAAKGAAKAQQKALKQLRELAKDHPSAITELCLARLALLEALDLGVKLIGLDVDVDVEREIEDKVHEALAHSVTAAAEHRSLAGLAQASSLLFLLESLPGIEQRMAQRERLAQAIPRERLPSLTPEFFGPLDKELVPSDLWPLDHCPGGSSTQASEVCALRLKEYERALFKHAQKDRDGFDIRQRIMKARRVSESATELPGVLETLRVRMAACSFLPARDKELLKVRVQAVQELQRQVDYDTIKRKREQEQKKKEERKAVLDRMFTARKRSFEMTQFLYKQLAAAGVPASEAFSADQCPEQLRALLHLASMPVAELKEQLLQGMPAAALQESAHQADLALQQLSADNTVHYSLPVSAVGDSGASSSASSTYDEYDECVRQLEALIAQPIAIAAAGASLQQELPLLAKLMQQLEGVDVNAVSSRLKDGSGSGFAADDLLGIPESDTDIRKDLLEYPLTRMLVEEDDLQLVFRAGSWRTEHKARVPRGITSHLRLQMATLNEPLNVLVTKWLEEQSALALKMDGVCGEVVMRAEMLEQAALMCKPEAEARSAKLAQALKPVLVGQQMIELVVQARQEQQGSGPSTGGCGSATSSSGDEDAFVMRLLHLQQAVEGRQQSLLELVQHCVPDADARRRATRFAQEVAAATEQAPHIFFHQEESSLLALLLLPLSRDLPAVLSEEVFEGQRADECVAFLDEVRVLVCTRVVAALQHLQVRGRLRFPLVHLTMLILHGMEVEQAGQLETKLRLQRQTGLVYPRLLITPVFLLLRLFAVLCIHFDQAFAGPADLGPRYQEAITIGRAGGQLFQQGAPEGSQHQEQAGNVLGLTRLGLARVISLAATVFKPGTTDPPLEQLVAGMAQAGGVGSSSSDWLGATWLAEQLPRVSQCANSLAMCACQVPAAAAELSKHQPGAYSRKASAAEDVLDAQVAALRRLRWWQGLLLCVRQFVSQAMDQALALAQLAGGDLPRCLPAMVDITYGGEESGEQVLAALDRVEEGCRQLPRSCRMAEAAVQVVQGLGSFLEMRARGTCFDQHARHVEGLLPQMPEGLHRAAAQDLFLQLLMHHTPEADGEAKLLPEVQKMCEQLASGSGVSDGESVVRKEHLLRVADTLARLRSGPAQADLQAGDRVGLPLQQQVLDGLKALALLGQAVQEVLREMVGVEGKLIREFDVAQRKVEVMLGHIRSRHCARTPLEPLTRLLVQRVLPRKWEQQMAAAQPQPALPAAEAACAAVPQEAGSTGNPSPHPGSSAHAAASAAANVGLAAVATKPTASNGRRSRPSGADGGDSAGAVGLAAAATAGGIDPDEAERQRQAALDALLREEAAEEERKARQRKKQGEAKRKAAAQQAAQRAEAAAAAAARKRKEEEAAARQAAAEREEEQRRRREQQQEEERQRAYHERMVQLAAEEERERQWQEQEQKRQEKEVQRQRQGQERPEQKTAATAEVERQRQSQDRQQVPPRQREEEGRQRKEAGEQQRASKQQQGRQQQPQSQSKLREGLPEKKLAAAPGSVSQQQQQQAVEQLDSQQQQSKQPAKPSANGPAAQVQQALQQGSTAAAPAGARRSTKHAPASQGPEADSAAAAGPCQPTAAVASKAQRGSAHLATMALKGVLPGSLPGPKSQQSDRQAYTTAPIASKATQQQEPPAAQPVGAASDAGAEASSKQPTKKQHHQMRQEQPLKQSTQQQQQRASQSGRQPTVAASSSRGSKGGAAAAQQAASTPKQTGSNRPAVTASAQQAHSSSEPGAMLAARFTAATAAATNERPGSGASGHSPHAASGAASSAPPNEAPGRPEPARTKAAGNPRAQGAATASSGTGSSAAQKGGPPSVPVASAWQQGRPALLASHEPSGGKEQPAQPRQAQPTSAASSSAAEAARQQQGSQSPAAGVDAGTATHPTAWQSAPDTPSPTGVASPRQPHSPPSAEPTGSWSTEANGCSWATVAAAGSKAAELAVGGDGLRSEAPHPSFMPGKQQQQQHPAAISLSHAGAAAAAASHAGAASTEEATAGCVGVGAAEGGEDLDSLLGTLGISSASVSPNQQLPEQQAQPPEQQQAPLQPAVGSVGGWSFAEAATTSGSLGGSWSLADAAAVAMPGAAAGAGIGSSPGDVEEDEVGLGAEAWPSLGQSQEDADLQAALHASLADSHAAAAQRRLAGAWQQHPPHQQQDQEQPHAEQQREQAATGTELALAGLRNEAGEYNCFLNVIVQCLWRCAEFRREVAGWDSALCAADGVVDALHGLFQVFEQQRSSDGSGGSLTPVDPSRLREALAALPGQQFGLGEMNDAGEVLLSIYERVMEVAAEQQRPTQLGAIFGLAVREEVACHACHKTTHQTSYTQYFHNTQATMLRLLCGLAGTMGGLLREAEAQHQKSCDEDLGGCGTPNPVNHFLEGTAPRVFTLQVAWESHSEAPDAIGATLEALDEEVDLGEVYQGADRGVHRYRLRSIVCYYGRHYQALVLVPEAGGWLMFDDTRVSRVGDWAEVRRKCEAGRIQPSVLFYEAMQG